MVSKTILAILTTVLILQAFGETEGSIARKIQNGLVGILNVCQTNQGVWEFVSPTRTSGRPCVFPFVYEGTTYMSCTKRNWFRHWCATAVDENLNFVPGFYGECCKCTSWWCWFVLLFGVETHCNDACPCEHGCP